MISMTKSKSISHDNKSDLSLKLHNLQKEVGIIIISLYFIVLASNYHLHYSNTYYKNDIPNYIFLLRHYSCKYIFLSVYDWVRLN